MNFQHEFIYQQNSKKQETSKVHKLIMMDQSEERVASKDNFILRKPFKSNIIL